MEISAYVCNQCTALFESAAPHSLEDNEVKCPECGSLGVEKLDVCGLEIGPPDWEYICHQCEASFELPVPRGPAEEKAAKCPECGSKDIERINVHVSEVCPPGG